MQRAPERLREFGAGSHTEKVQIPIKSRGAGTPKCAMIRIRIPLVTPASLVTKAIGRRSTPSSASRARNLKHTRTPWISSNVSPSSERKTTGYRFPAVISSASAGLCANHIADFAHAFRRRAFGVRQSPIAVDALDALDIAAHRDNT